MARNCKCNACCSGELQLAATNMIIMYEMHSKPEPAGQQLTKLDKTGRILHLHLHLHLHHHSTPLHLQQLFGNHLSTTSAFMAIRMGCSGRQGLAMAVLGASCPFNLSKWLAIEIETKIAQSEYDVGAAKHKCFQMHRALKEGFGFSVRPLELVLSY